MQALYQMTVRLSSSHKKQRNKAVEGRQPQTHSLPLHPPPSTYIPQTRTHTHKYSGTYTNTHNPTHARLLAHTHLGCSNAGQAAVFLKAPLPHAPQLVCARPCLLPCVLSAQARAPQQLRCALQSTQVRPHNQQTAQTEPHLFTLAQLLRAFAGARPRQARSTPPLDGLCLTHTSICSSIYSHILAHIPVCLHAFTLLYVTWTHTPACSSTAQHTNSRSRAAS